MKCLCISKYRENDGTIFQYVLEDAKQVKKIFESQQLKDLIRSGQLEVVNLTLTKDGRLIDKKFENFKVSRKQGDKHMERYEDLLYRINWKECGAEQQLKDRIESIQYLDITDEKGYQMGFIFTEEIQSLIEKIQRAYDNIKITDNKTEINSEVFYTCTIEGAKTTLKRTELITKGKKPENYSEKMVYNSYQATKYLNIIRQSEHITESILVKVWKTLTKEACDNVEIAGDIYRTGGVRVGSHEAPHAEDIPWLMERWFNFINSSTLNPLIKAAVIHFYFVYIHPFCDGNGRTARLISTDYLIRAGYDKFKAISISKGIYERINDYYSSLQDSENKYNDMTFFVEYYLQTIERTLNKILFN